MALNSLWGKMGQKQERSLSELVFEPKRFYEMIHRADLDCIDLHVIYTDVVEIIYKQKKEVLK